ncbi:MAG TPA: hypothetical protein VKA30_10680 [Actinomycetota bacterium]|nr:hypothetical protein [Actinomycetota bacterium]
MAEAKSAAFESYRDMTKQAVTLATGVLALTVTFVKDVVKEVTALERGVLLIGWLALVLSVVFGVLTLMAISGALHCIENEDSQPCAELPKPITIYASNVRTQSAIQLVLFGLGILILILFGLLTI